jgi:SPP1 gp7 family putative phage head morphogenesis protein
MSVLDDHLKKHRKQIIDREERTFRQLMAAYDDIEKDLVRAYRELQKKILEAQAAGEEISPSWFYRERRLKLLLDQVNDQVVRFGGKASPVIAREQNAAIRIAIEQTKDTFKIIGPDTIRTDNIGSQLAPRVVENAVGAMGDGSPLMSYFTQQLAPAVAEKIKTEVIKAAATGTNFNTIAGRLMKAGDITRSRAFAVARTEVSRVRRETTRQIYEENADVVSGWEWVASKSLRTCPVCLAMDGKVYTTDKPFPQHMNCRCTLIPVLIGVKRPPRTIGRDWFDGLDEIDQVKILGKDATDHYRNGDLKLKDFVGWKTDKRFGKSVYRKPLAKILADQAP